MFRPRPRRSQTHRCPDGGSRSVARASPWRRLAECTSTPSKPVRLAFRAARLYCIDDAGDLVSIQGARHRDRDESPPGAPGSRARSCRGRTATESCRRSRSSGSGAWGQLRLEAAVTAARHLDRQLAELALSVLRLRPLRVLPTGLATGSCRSWPRCSVISASSAFRRVPRVCAGSSCLRAMGQFPASGPFTQNLGRAP